ncbi:MAG: hypothetical protein C0518_09415 [Opitutus sp.]|nr:hypothetical protein [Opitutus sp.]
MNETKPRVARRLRLRLYTRRFAQYFLHGVLVIAPVAITIAALVWVFTAVDKLLRPLIDIPGLGFITVIALIVFTGWLSSFFVIEQVIDFFDDWLERLPGISLVYSPVRDFLKALVGRKRRFNRTVLASLFADDVWVVGFLTNEDVTRFELGEDYVSVYIPQAYNVAGQAYLVPRHRIRLLESVPAGEAMRYAVTGGAAEGTKSAVGTAAAPAPLP